MYLTSCKSVVTHLLKKLVIFELHTTFSSLFGSTTGCLVAGLEVKGDFLGDVVKREASCKMMLLLLTRSDAFTKPLVHVLGSPSFKGYGLAESASKLEYRRCVLVH